MKRIIAVILVLITISNTVSAAEYIPRYSYVLMEGTTAALLYSDNGNMSFHPKHSSKLMTLLLVAEAIENGVISADTVVKVSEHANSMGDPQIWLRVGEEITVSDLIMSITAGNANDACVTLAESVAKTESDFVELMNNKAKELGLADTHYTDCTGTDNDSYTTASDTAIVASCLSKFKWLDEYFTTYITYVRNNQTQLVNTNRLIRNYDYCTGMKYYYSDETGHCLIACGRKDGMTLICVIMGEQDKDMLFKTAREKLGIGFSAYEMYKPKLSDVICIPVRVSTSVQGQIKTKLDTANSFVIRKSKKDDIDISVEYFESVEAPLKAGEPVGRVVYSIDGEELYSVNIVADENADRLTFLSALKKILTSIIKM